MTDAQSGESPRPVATGGVGASGATPAAMVMDEIEEEEALAELEVVPVLLGVAASGSGGLCGLWQPRQAV